MLSESLPLTALVFVGVAFIVFVTYLIAIYNSLVQVRNNVDKAFKNIDVLLLQRNDELPKLIDICKGYMEHEKEL